MSIIREIPPTAGWPLTIRSLVASLFKKHSSGLLEEDFRKYLGASAALLTYSGDGLPKQQITCGENNNFKYK